MRSLDSNNDNDREKRPKPVDAHVGSRIRLRRTILSMTQERLADALGLTFQQVQKYERGANRVGASRLFDLARVLDVPISFFFDDLPETAVGTDPGAPRRRMLSGFTQESPGDEPTSRRQTLELARAFNGITDAARTQAGSRLDQVLLLKPRIRPSLGLRGLFERAWKHTGPGFGRGSWLAQ